MSKFYHSYHLVSESPWPLVNSFTLLNLLMGVVKWMNEYSMTLLVMSYVLLLFNLYMWWRDVVRESTLQGSHTIQVYMGLQMGMILFILSEVMFFLSFFWSYFHMFLSPSIELGNVWPPSYIMLFNIYNIPLLNTLLLLSSGVTITWSHYLILMNKMKISFNVGMLTVFLGGIFMYFQFLEYSESFFTITDSVYGTVFFMMTGFHGLHVTLGVIFLMVSYMRLLFKHYSKIHHFGFEAASWYWHFVDVVWLFLYLFIYWMSY